MRCCANAGENAGPEMPGRRLESLDVRTIGDAKESSPALTAEPESRLDVR